MPINTTPAGLQQPQNTSTSGSQTTTSSGQGASTSVLGLQSPIGANQGGGDGEATGDGDGDGGGGTTSNTGSTGGTGGASLPLGSENFRPAASGTGGNVGTSGGSGGSVTVNQNAQALVDRVGRAAKGGDMAGVVHGMTTMLNLAGTDDFSGMSVQMIIQKVLMEAYEGSQKDLRSIANRYQFFNNVKNNIRNESSRARAALASADSTGKIPVFSAHQTTNTLDPDGKDGKVSFSQAADWNPFTPIDGSSIDPNTAQSGRGSNGTILDKNTLSAYADKLDKDLDTAGDNSSEMQTRLQAVTNEQQQLLSTITQLLKNWNDVSMSIIHNV